ncbi:MAG: IS5/IS1182 family transposase, partial [Nitrosomonas sp.]|nr:IS5/IS1182 family transposase [Nitrosomonas sp.]
MIRYTRQNQPALPGFATPAETVLDSAHRWVSLGNCIPWDDLAQSYHKTLSATQGRPCKDARIVIGVIIIKHKLSLSDV